MVTKVESGWRELDWEFGINRCKPVYVEWINRKILLYSTGNYVQFPPITITEKNMKKNVDTCITESFSCIAVINTTL